IHCNGAECAGSGADHQTGSIAYQITGASYSVVWMEHRADNQPLYTQRRLTMDGAAPVEKFILDGEVYDLYHDVRSGQTHRVAFSARTTAALALPIERYTSVRGAIDEAVIASNNKFATVFDRYCKTPGDHDVRTFCDSSSLLPSKEMLAPACAEMNES